jgi:hypothetical protein
MLESIITSGLHMLLVTSQRVKVIRNHVVFAANSVRRALIIRAGGKGRTCAARADVPTPAERRA